MQCMRCGLLLRLSHVASSVFGKMPFGADLCRPKEPCIRSGSISPTGRIEQFCGLYAILKIIGSLCCSVCSSRLPRLPTTLLLPMGGSQPVYVARDDSILNKGTTARLLQLTAMLLTAVSHYTVPTKIRRLRYDLSTKYFGHLFLKLVEVVKYPLGIIGAGFSTSWMPPNQQCYITERNSKP